MIFFGPIFRLPNRPNRRRHPTWHHQLYRKCSIFNTDNIKGPFQQTCRLRWNKNDHLKLELGNMNMQIFSLKFKLKKKYIYFLLHLEVSLQFGVCKWAFYRSLEDLICIFWIIHPVCTCIFLRPLFPYKCVSATEQPWSTGCRTPPRMIMSPETNKCGKWIRVGLFFYLVILWYTICHWKKLFSSEKRRLYGLAAPPLGLMKRRSGGHNRCGFRSRSTPYSGRMNVQSAAMIRQETKGYKLMSRETSFSFILFQKKC